MRNVRLTRQVTFSSGHRYWHPALTVEENRRRFGEWASPFNHGHNYVLRVTTLGTINPRDGMVVNIKTIDDILQREVVQRFDQKSINDEVTPFETTPPTTENLTLFFAEALPNLLPVEAKLDELRLEETPSLAAKWKDGQVTLTRSYEFAAAHRLHSDNLSPSENLELYGKCNNVAGHGHNYVLEVEVAGPVNEQTGMLVDISALDSVVNREIVDRYDHRNFNCDLPEFAGLNPTSEVVCDKIFTQLSAVLPIRLVSVRLWETPRNMFEVRA